MATILKLAEFNAFVAKLANEEIGELSIDDVYDRWWEETHRDEDLAAVREAIEDYQAGDRGVPAREVLAQLNALRKTSET